MGENLYTNALSGEFYLSETITNIGRGGIAFALQEDAPDDAKTIIKKKNNSIYIQTCKDGKVIKEIAVIPDIVDVSVSKRNGNVKVIFVTFADGSMEKAVLNDDDTFSFEQGISICITKRLLSQECDGCGSAVYNKLIKRGLKVYENAENEKARMLAEKDAQEQKFGKLRKKKAEKKAKREAAMREREISIQAEAYLRAMREFNSTSDESAE